MEPAIRFCPTEFGRVAYATIGEGPALVFPPPWVGHIEAGWRLPGVRDWFVAFAQRHRVIWYDPLGSGLSERRRAEEDFTLDVDARVVGAVIDAAGIERCTLFGLSAGGSYAAAYAAANPQRVQRLILCSSYADGSRITDAETERTIPELVARNWSLGSSLLSTLFAPTGQEEHRRLREFHRAAATPDMASRLLRYAYEIDGTDAFRQVQAPTLVMHRRGDRVVPHELGVEVACLVPGARFQPLDGDDHFPWRGDTAQILRAVAEFVRLGPYTADQPAAQPDEDAPELTAREREVLALVAEGLSDREIAERLVLSAHTIHRHVANIRRKLDQPSRAGAAAAAARRGLI